jgi:hypothetical protein
MRRYQVCHPGGGTMTFEAASDEAAIALADMMPNVGNRGTGHMRPDVTQAHVAVWQVTADGGRVPITHEAKARG